MEQNNKIFNSDKLNTEFEKLKLNIKWHNNIPYFTLKNISNLLLFCERNEVRILGAEGFYFENNNIVPNINEILDLSQIKDVKQSIDFARRYFEDISEPNMFFEFVFNK